MILTIEKFIIIIISNMQKKECGKILTSIL